jgi:hypothetical protein
MEDTIALEIHETSVSVILSNLTDEEFDTFTDCILF